MKFLADTHVLLWWDAEPEKIGSKALSIIKDPTNEILFSHASLWEMTIKIKLDKLKLSQSLEIWIQKSVVGNGFLMQPITLPAILKTQELDHHHGDPFDRLLIAQALSLNIPVISADKVWEAYGVNRIWD